MAIADLTLQEVEDDGFETSTKNDILMLKNQAQGAVTQLKAVVQQLDNSAATTAARGLKAAIVQELRETFQE